MSKEFSPRSQRQNEVLIEIGQAKGTPFKHGVYNDLPGSSVRKTAVHDSIGYIPFEDQMRAAGGCKAWSNTLLPALPGRTGYSFTKSGSVITKTVGDDFTEEDVGQYIVHDDGVHELTTAFYPMTPNQITVESDEAHTASTAGWVRGQINGTTDKALNGKYLMHIDTRLFVFNANVSAYTEVYCISYLKLLNSHSVIDIDGETAIIYNANGIFRVDLSVDVAPYFYWKCNSPVPRVLLTGEPRIIGNDFAYKYTYGMSRIDGDELDRNRISNTVIHETGPCLISSTDFKDYAENWGNRPVGIGDTTYAILTGAALGASYDTASDWSALGSNCQWSIPINGETYTFSVDMVGCITMAEVAWRLQSAMRTANSSITCVYSTDRFVITNPVEGGTLGYTTASPEGTDIGATAMGCQSGTGSITNNPFTFRRIIATLYCPVDPTDSTKVQQHHTHYRVDRTLDIGPNGIDPLTGEANNEEQFIWHSDVPIAKALVVSRSGSTVTAWEGFFDPMDVGAKLRCQDGTEIVLITYVNEVEMESFDSGTISQQAAAIGGDNSLSKPIRVMTAGQAGQLVTRTDGAIFSSTDVGKTIFWPSGIRSHIIEYLDANRVNVPENQTIASTAACMDPKCRNFCDIIRDDTLRGRINDYSLLHRFWSELPDCDTGKLTPGWMFAAIRETKTGYYSQVTQGKEHLIGYYYAARQYVKYKDTILGFSDFPDSMTVYCARSTTIHPTNTSIVKKINAMMSINLIAGQTVADEQRGVWDSASYKKLPDGVDVVVTNEPRLRIFDGRSFGSDIADKRYTKLIEKLERAMAIFYEGTHGLTIYGRQA